jgi:hypothetical protein
MKPADLKTFSDALGDMMDVLSGGKHALSPRHVALWFHVLESWPLAVVTKAMMAHMRNPETGRTLPIPSDIVAQIQGAAAMDGRPGSDEAWAIAQGTEDESATVVWTDEMAHAWGIARTLVLAGDRVGARMAFREAYDRQVQQARAKRIAVRWSASLGHDARRRAEAIEAAAAKGIAIGGPAEDALALPAADPAATLLAWAGKAESAEGSTTARDRAVAALKALGRTLDQGDQDRWRIDSSDRDRTNELRDAATAAVIDRLNMDEFDNAYSER